MTMGYGKRIRVQADVCKFFDKKYPESPITLSVASNVDVDFDHVRDNNKTNSYTVPEKHTNKCVV